MQLRASMEGRSTPYTVGELQFKRQLHYYRTCSEFARVFPELRTQNYWIQLERRDQQSSTGTDAIMDERA